MNEYNVDFRLDDGILYVHLSGKFPKEMLDTDMNLFQPLKDSCLTHKCNKALIDARDLDVDFQTMDMFRAGEDAAAMAGLCIRIAFVAREDMLDSFFANVAYNRGANVGVFKDMDNAREWLQN